MEELVGRLWHQFIAAPSAEHEQARIHLNGCARAPSSCCSRGRWGHHRTPARQTKNGGRGWLQEIAGSATHDHLPMLDTDSLALPPSIAIFQERALNRFCLWLATLAACHIDTGHWIDDNL